MQAKPGTIITLFVDLDAITDPIPIPRSTVAGSKRIAMGRGHGNDTGLGVQGETVGGHSRRQ